MDPRSGGTAALCARSRRDLPADQAAAPVGLIGLRRDDVVVDLGCGTGQLAVLRQHCAAVVAIDPEPATLVGLRARRVPGVVCVLGDDGDLPTLGRARCGSVVGAGPAVGGVGAVARWQADHAVDVEWVLGHLGSATGADALRDGTPGGLADRLREVLAEVGPATMVEEVVTTTAVGRRSA